MYRSNSRSLALATATAMMTGLPGLNRMAGMPPRGINFDGEENPPAGDPPAGDPPAGDPPPAGGKKKIEFTPEQQAYLESLNNEAFGKGFKKAEAQSKKDKEEFQKQIDDLKKLIPAPAPTDPPGQKKAYSQEEVEQMIEEAKKPLAEEKLKVDQRAQSILNKERLTAIKAAAIKAKAADEEDVAVLLDRFVRHDDENNLVVINAEGHPRLDGNGKPMTVELFVKQYIESKPHLQASSGKNGAGSGSHNQGPGKSGPPKNMAEATAAFAKAMDGQRIQ